MKCTHKSCSSNKPATHVHIIYDKTMTWCQECVTERLNPGQTLMVPIKTGAAASVSQASNKYASWFDAIPE